MYSGIFLYTSSRPLTSLANVLPLADAFFRLHSYFIYVIFDFQSKCLPMHFVKVSFPLSPFFRSALFCTTDFLVFLILYSYFQSELSVSNPAVLTTFYIVFLLPYMVLSLLHTWIQIPTLFAQLNYHKSKSLSFNVFCLRYTLEFFRIIFVIQSQCRSATV